MGLKDKLKERINGFRYVKFDPIQGYDTDSRDVNAEEAVVNRPVVEKIVVEADDQKVDSTKSGESKVFDGITKDKILEPSEMDKKMARLKLAKEGVFVSETKLVDGKSKNNEKVLNDNLEANISLTSDGVSVNGKDLPEALVYIINKMLVLKNIPYQKDNKCFKTNFENAYKFLLVLLCAYSNLGKSQEEYKDTTGIIYCDMSIKKLCIRLIGLNDKLTEDVVFDHNIEALDIIGKICDECVKSIIAEEEAKARKIDPYVALIDLANDPSLAEQFSSENVVAEKADILIARIEATRDLYIARRQALNTFKAVDNSLALIKKPLNNDIIGFLSEVNLDNESKALSKVQ